ncbi:MAG: hypothetical protein ABI640_20910 [Gammaproteobacteria bacterium]
MIPALRNGLIAVAALLGATLSAAVAQNLLRYIAPAVSAQVVGGTDVVSLLGFAFLGLAFVCVGLWVPGWLKSRLALVWLLAPIIGAYLAALFQEPRIFGCAAVTAQGCWLFLSPFIVAGAAVGLGYVLRVAVVYRNVV